MPRFGIKSLLIVSAGLALWLSTFSRYAAASDVRKALLLAVLIASSYAAIRFEGRRRAFWGGFAVTMLIHGFTIPFDPSVPELLWFGYAPKLDWSGHATNKLLPYIAASGSQLYQQLYPAVQATFAALWVLVVSMLIGWICAHVYDQTAHR